MKKKFFAIVISVLLLASCGQKPDDGGGEDEKERVYYLSRTMSAGEKYIIKRDNAATDVLKYIDLSSGDMGMKPLCSRPNCAHTDNSCAAYSLREAEYPFLRNEKLYYFDLEHNLKNEVVGYAFYQAETDGTGQKKLFSTESGNLDQVNLFGDVLVLSFYADETDDFYTGSARNYRIYAYDFSELRLVYDTGTIYDGGLYVWGAIDGYLYIQYRGRDYPVDVPLGKSIWDYMGDKNSIFYKDFINEQRRLSLNRQDPLNPEYEVIGLYIYVAGDCYYVFDEDAQTLRRTNAVTGKTDVFYEGYKIRDDAFYEIDGKVFLLVGSGVDGDERRMIYYNGSGFTEIDGSAEFGFYYETGDYLFGSFVDADDNYITGYISKSDFYKGDWDKFEQWDEFIF
ncbi:MAG: hypothetical protein LBI36_02225 [Oscillospiraceae bacterium]|jgi:hypothetical protein|nr:hypothetical protein [Oscillospiraceae bacterium]